MKRIVISENNQLEWGKQLHERGTGVSIIEAAEQLGISKGTAWALLKTYRESAGIPPSPQALSAKKRKGPYRTKPRQPELPMSNGNGSLERVQHVSDASLRVQIQELNNRLHDAMEEVHTLQKILMVIGKTL